jgi:Zn-dependent protease
MDGLCLIGRAARRTLLSCFYVGRIVGIPTYLHWSIFLVSYLLWLGQGWTPVLQFGALLVSVLLHELGHCYFARKHGLGVGSITLSPLGGMARIDLGIPEPLTEFEVVVAGPLTTLALTILATPIWYFSQGTPVGALFGFIAWVNAYIYLFNLAPAFPLDGGRILRSLLNWKSGDVLWATKVAVNVGRIASLLMWAIGTYFGQLGVMIIAAIVFNWGPRELSDLEAKLAARRLSQEMRDIDELEHQQKMVG